MLLKLRAGEKLYINGAVIKVERKATIELMNDAAFLLEAHVIQPDDASTPLKQLYFVLQTQLMERDGAPLARQMFSNMVDATCAAFGDGAVRDGLRVASHAGRVQPRVRSVENHSRPVPAGIRDDEGKSAGAGRSLKRKTAMTVSSISGVGTTPTTTLSASSSAAAGTTASSAALNYNQFLQLLMTEMQNQDPTQPMDPTSQLSQLASFSAVEQQVQTNTTLTSLLNTASLQQAESAMGLTATSSDGSVSGTISSVTINSSGSTATLSNGSTLTLGSGVTIS